MNKKNEDNKKKRERERSHDVWRINNETLTFGRPLYANWKEKMKNTISFKFISLIATARLKANIVRLYDACLA